MPNDKKNKAENPEIIIELNETLSTVLSFSAEEKLLLFSTISDILAELGEKLDPASVSLMTEVIVNNLVNASVKAAGMGLDFNKYFGAIQSMFGINSEIEQGGKTPPTVTRFTGKNKTGI